MAKQQTDETPMMKQYKSIKDQYQDAFLFYRLGDFYELFYDDAIKSSKILELTLTSRSKTNPVPMCGIPRHVANNYIQVLIDQGYKVAICEQVEDVNDSKGMVKREVVQVITPGTNIDQKGEDNKSNNYITSLVFKNDRYGFSYADLSTGELKSTVLDDEQDVLNEIVNTRTKEIVVEDLKLTKTFNHYFKLFNILVSPIENYEKSENNFEYLTKNLTDGTSKQAISNLLKYINHTQKRMLDHLQLASSYEVKSFLKMDAVSKNNLELTSLVRSNKKEGSLLWFLDNTNTAMGARLLKQWIDRPLVDSKEITNRQIQTQVLIDSFLETDQLRKYLTNIYDLERLSGRVAFGSVNGRDLTQLKNSLAIVPNIKQLIKDLQNSIFKELLDNMDECQDVWQLLEDSINEESSVYVTDGWTIKDGYNTTLDKYRDAMQNGKQWIMDLQEQERQKTKIKNLKVGFNKVFGYYIEVTKSNLHLVPKDRFERKQTLANAERFITPELKEKERLILEAEKQTIDLNYEIFLEVRTKVQKEIQRLQQLAKKMAYLDVIQSFSYVSERYQLVKPQLTDQNEVNIIDGRHPVIEKIKGYQNYVSNNIQMDEGTQILLITGPNMAGKSTYMRQMALTIIMNQIGCFVAAKKAILPVFDQIFTRIGATDDLTAGQSTFMVEMQEANRALKNATKNSLILLDELGRGTATYDGMALAQAIVEYIDQNIHAKTLFSTHYHELTVLDKQIKSLQNIHAAVTEKDGVLSFAHKIIAGAADESYGIQVAKLAGMPDNVIKRADVILKQLDQNSGSKNNLKSEKVADINQENNSEILDNLKTMNLMDITPIEAMNYFYQWQKHLQKGD